MHREFCCATCGTTWHDFPLLDTHRRYSEGNTRCTAMFLLAPIRTADTGYCTLAGNTRGPRSRRSYPRSCAHHLQTATKTKAKNTGPVCGSDGGSQGGREGRVSRWGRKADPRPRRLRRKDKEGDTRWLLFPASKVCVCPTLCGLLSRSNASSATTPKRQSSPKPQHGGHTLKMVRTIHQSSPVQVRCAVCLRKWHAISRTDIPQVASPAQGTKQAWTEEGKTASSITENRAKKKGRKKLAQIVESGSILLDRAAHSRENDAEDVETPQAKPTKTNEGQTMKNLLIFLHICVYMTVGILGYKYGERYEDDEDWSNSATSLRACYPMSVTELAYDAVLLRVCYPMSDY
eukprot:832161-Rhodomonas_salina.1